MLGLPRRRFGQVITGAGAAWLSGLPVNSHAQATGISSNLADAYFA
jgi:hypothetical protein